MIHKIFSVRDAKVDAYLQPFFAPTHGSALRSLTDAVNDPKHEFFKHAADYSLWYLGDFDDSDGVLVRHETGRPVHVMDCRELLGKD